MKFLYQAFISIYLISIYFASIWNYKAKQWLKGRKQLLNQIAKSYDNSNKSLWVHCASLGELEQARPIIEKLRSNYPQKRIVLSFFSPSGYEVRKNNDEVDAVFYLPIDTKHNAKIFIKLINPELAIFIKSEFWFNYIQELDIKRIPFIFVSSKFRTSQYFFKWYGKWFFKQLMNSKAIFVQDEISLKLLNEKGFKQTHITGDTRIDRVFEMAKNVLENSLIEAFKGNSKLIIAGSTWPKDEALFTDFIKLNPEVKFIIAPHEIDSTHLENLAKVVGGNDSVFLTNLTLENAHSKSVLIIDRIGLLASLYYYADIVYIGGGFGKGIHNLLEPASYGKPIIFGPNFDKFKEAIDLIELGAAFSFKNKESFLEVITNLLENENLCRFSCNQSKSYIEQNIGASNLVCQKISEILRYTSTI